MRQGNEEFLILTIKVKVRPESKVVNLLKRYRNALNYSIRWIIENSDKNNRKKHKTPSLGKIHRNLYEYLKKRFSLPPRLAVECYREALAIAKSYFGNGANGKMPSAKTLRMRLAYNQSYRIRDKYVEITGGYKLEIIGKDKRYDYYEDREAILVCKDDEMFLMVAKRIPKPKPIACKGVLAVDINEKFIYVGNSSFIERYETAIEKAIHFKKLAEKLQKKYSLGKYRAWTRNKILRRIRYFHRKAKNIMEDWSRKTALKIVLKAKQNNYAIAIEDLSGLIKTLRKLPKKHRAALITLSYRKLVYWICWEAMKHGIKIIVVDPKNTSSLCPVCRSKLVKSNHRILTCPKCRFQGDRDTVAVLNIEKKALVEMGGSLATPTAPKMKDVNPNRLGEPMK